MGVVGEVGKRGGMRGQTVVGLLDCGCRGDGELAQLSLAGDSSHSAGGSEDERHDCCLCIVYGYQKCVLIVRSGVRGM